jgi:hypothetical protein
MRVISMVGTHAGYNECKEKTLDDGVTHLPHLKGILQPIFEVVQ